MRHSCTQAIPMRDTESVELKRTQTCTKLFKKHSHYKATKTSVTKTFHELCSPKLSKHFETQSSDKERLLKHWKCKTSHLRLHCHSLPPACWERGAKALIPIGSLYRECRKQVGDSTQCLHISLDVASWRSAYAPFPPRKHCWPLVQVLEIIGNRPAKNRSHLG